MRASVKPGQPTDTRSYQLRVYPNAQQAEWMETACRARQWAYNFGTKLYRSQWRDRFEQLKVDPSCFTLIESLPKIKRLSGTAVSRLITAYLMEIKRCEIPWNKQTKWVERYHYTCAQQRKKSPDKKIIPLTPVELRAAYTQAKKTPWVERHPFAWLLDVPRSILTQGVNDYQASLSAKFEDMKKPRSERLGRGWPTTKALHECAGFTVQLERPATSQHLNVQWKAGRIPLGPESMGAVRYRDDLALPEKIPSLVSFKQSASGCWHASFAVKVKEGRQFRNKARVLREAVKSAERDELAVLLQQPGNRRAVGNDPNFELLVFNDSMDLAISVVNPRQRREDHAKQSRRDKHLSRTSRGCKPRHGRPGRQPSNRSKKARQQAAKLREHGANITKDFQKKVASVVGAFYAQHHFEGTNHKVLRKTKRRGNAFAWADTSPGRQMQLIKQKASACHPDALLVTCSSSFPSSQRCWSCKTINPQVKDGKTFWSCRNPLCGMHHHRDECASRNILDEGFRISQPQDSNSSSRIDVSTSCVFGWTTPMGERYCAHQTTLDFTPFEHALVARFERNQVFVQVRRFSHPGVPDGTGHLGG